MESTTDRCEFCGAPIEKESFKIGGHTLELPQPCNCPQATSERQRVEEEREKAERMERRDKLHRRLKAAGIRKRYIDATHPEAKEYARKIAEGKSLYLTGSFGTGKTHLACAIARILTYHGRRVKFVTSVDLLIELQSTYGKAEAEADVLAKYSNCDVLVIDDLGKEPPTEWALSRLYAIINNRDADLLPVIVTSNYKTSELTGRMAGCDESTAEALASRLTGMCEQVAFQGEDRRLQ